MFPKLSYQCVNLRLWNRSFSENQISNRKKRRFFFGHCWWMSMCDIRFFHPSHLKTVLIQSMSICLLIFLTISAQGQISLKGVNGFFVLMRINAAETKWGPLKDLKRIIWIIHFELCFSFFRLESGNFFLSYLLERVRFFLYFTHVY